MRDHSTIFILIHMSEAVRKAIIEPMRELYLSPLHLRRDAEAQERAIAVYEKALTPFDRETLERAWAKVIAGQTYWVWPNPGVIVAACQIFAPRLKTPSEAEQRTATALAMTDQYVAGYMRTSQVAKLAKREGWASHLREFVTDVAWVQAQLICHIQHIGWNPRLADSLGNFPSLQDAFQAYRETLAKPVEEGQIRVTVPRRRIQEWKEYGRLPDQNDQDQPSGRSLG